MKIIYYQLATVDELLMSNDQSLNLELVHDNTMGMGKR
jgi:hypothetical protein